MQVGTRTLIVNPVSGTGTHAEWVRRKARAKGFAVWETEGAEHGVELAREAARDGVGELAVCGGDGTINEVLRGLAAEEHLGEVTLDVVPAGTANLLAGTLGIRDTRHGLDLTDDGEVRSVDVGVAGGEPFLVSCIAGLPADASTAASGDLKERLGTLAFVVTGVQEALEFDGLHLELEARAGAETEHWEGDAMCVLVGNARKFVEEGGQADMEDGLFDVAVVERMPAGNLAIEAVTHRILGRGTEGVAHFRADEVDIVSDGPVRFSRDGELSEHESLHLDCRRQTLDVRVGPTYEPSP
ncbi:diacylglycerol kinase family lipid kinase [Salinirubellus salinus]|uniref:Diacylglycerol kinase family lipid kinase n=1 Tax=Salinirubellus salinus TaxID=1364945 RepID=A0A9E7UAB9_9EURY|nr:diacylglycerol kinase family protein [Salinirubellus salinus]UWM53852.1 diacylglycerol kinase family lipid kinase [Salinirubellus salinus]